MRAYEFRFDALYLGHAPERGIFKDNSNTMSKVKAELSQTS